MCGIAGFVTVNEVADLTRLKKMTDVLAHRGPDGNGHWINEEKNVALGHRRLSIIDLSYSGAQPMLVLGKYVIVFNGEIYNYLELKEVLAQKGYHFNSSSDTEVIALMYDLYKEACLEYLDGMFAFVIYDQRENVLFGARDRFGEKPFYYTSIGDSFYFASEIKALWAAGADRQISPDFLYNYLSFGYLQDPNGLSRTFYNGIDKLPASHYLVLNVNTHELKIERYWDIDLSCREDETDERKIIDQFKELFYTSVKRRLRSDVPLGSSLSGGLDSSVIVSVLDFLDANNQIRRKTFSAGFPGFERDETRYQNIVIADTTVEPFFVYPDQSSFLENFRTIAYHQDEPFGSASINIQFEVFKKAKEENTTVLLDGQGADEILAGYHGYYHAFFDEIRNADKKEYREQYAKYQELHDSNSINATIVPSKYYRLRKILPSPLTQALKNSLARNPSKSLFSREFYSDSQNSKFLVREHFDTLNEALYYSVFHFGLEELLRYADRNSMAHSREVRLPFLNHELVEFIFSLPAVFKMKDGWTKWILRKSFEGQVDKTILWRRDKIGYEPPQQSWMKNEFVQDSVRTAANSLASSGVLNRQALNLDQLDQKTFWRLLSISGNR